MEVLGAEGHAYPTFCGVSTRQMTCAINGLDISALSTFGLNGLALTTFKSFFRKIAEGGVRVAEVTASHIKFSGTEGMLLPRGARGPNNRPLTGEWNIVPTFDGTNSTVAVSTGSAIS
jgi:hypothetical protein